MSSSHLFVCFDTFRIIAQFLLVCLAFIESVRCVCIFLFLFVCRSCFVLIFICVCVVQCRGCSVVITVINRLAVVSLLVITSCVSE